MPSPSHSSSSPSGRNLTSPYGRAPWGLQGEMHRLAPRLDGTGETLAARGQQPLTGPASRCSCVCPPLVFSKLNLALLHLQSIHRSLGVVGRMSPQVWSRFAHAQELSTSLRMLSQPRQTISPWCSSRPPPVSRMRVQLTTTLPGRQGLPNADPNVSRGSSC
ncbi:hypothetical protein VTK73DRAFT_8688 [Phialemonium thermophilum]|uniref:Uncharacterized protein n=1 Tax=Phialemonium thermophilum TaxID=223376 RepID=A0ABR3W771_9PEZI